MKLSKIEKREMLKDALDKGRRYDFRKARIVKSKMSFEEYVSWLNELQSVLPKIKQREFIRYKNVKI